jgi:hypothetical protein
MSLAFGLAGVGAWDAPIIAYYWPLGFGAASLGLAIAAGTASEGKTPWFAFVAVLAALGALAMGFDGHSQMQDVRDGLNQFSMR